MKAAALRMRPVGPGPQRPAARRRRLRHRREPVDQDRAGRDQGDHRAQARARGARPRRDQRVALAAQPPRGAPAARRPAEHVRRARQRRRDLHQAALDRFVAGPVRRPCGRPNPKGAKPDAEQDPATPRTVTFSPATC